MEGRDSKKLFQSLRWAGVAVGMLWVIHFALYIFGVDPGYLGIIPRTGQGLIGIFTAPLVHKDIFHLLSNSGPLFIFLAATFYFYRNAAVRAVFWIYLMTGVWVWIVAHAGSHIGASGLVYGFAAFIFFSGVFRRDVRSIALALIMAFFYGGMVWGVLPTEEGISWESHLFGAIAGAIVAWFLRELDRLPKKKYHWEDEPENEPGDENAVWNYQQNWSGGQNIYYHGQSGERKSD